jgi:MAGUK p55 subfamily protein 5
MHVDGSHQGWQLLKFAKSYLPRAGGQTVILYTVSSLHDYFSLTDTSRPIKDDELNGKDYHFVERHVFESDIQEHKFVEYGEYEKNFYGTSLEAIREVVNSGKMCVLNLYPQVSRNGDYSHQSNIRTNC